MGAVRVMSLSRSSPFESTKITVASFPLNLTFSPREKEITTSSDTYETVSRGRDEGYWLVPITTPAPGGDPVSLRGRGDWPVEDITHPLTPSHAGREDWLLALDD